MRRTPDGDVKVGVVEDVLSLMDVRIQIGEAKADGYYIRRDADEYIAMIMPNGHIDCSNYDYPFSTFDDFLTRTINLKYNEGFLSPLPSFDSENLVVTDQESS